VESFDVLKDFVPCWQRKARIGEPRAAGGFRILEAREIALSNVITKLLAMERLSDADP
jgi:hypothetical protein